MNKKKEENIKEISTTTFSEILYRSVVTIDYVDKFGKIIKSYKTHNNIGNQLKLFIFNCLAGNYDKNLRPIYGVPYVIDNGTYKSLIDSSYIAQINDYNINVTADSIEYKIFIPESMIVGKTVDGIALYNENYKSQIQENTVLTNYCMKVDIDQVVNSTISLIISWKIMLDGTQKN